MRTEANEIAHWAWKLVDPGDDRIVVMRYELESRCLLTAHNLCSHSVKLGTQPFRVIILVLICSPTAATRGSTRGAPCLNSNHTVTAGSGFSAMVNE